jgi:hypothetical protein
MKLAVLTALLVFAGLSHAAQAITFAQLQVAGATLQIDYSNAFDVQAEYFGDAASQSGATFTTGTGQASGSDFDITGSLNTTTKKGAVGLTAKTVSVPFSTSLSRLGFAAALAPGDTAQSTNLGATSPFSLINSGSTEQQVTVSFFSRMQVEWVSTGAGGGGGEALAIARLLADSTDVVTQTARASATDGRIGTTFGTPIVNTSVTVAPMSTLNLVVTIDVLLDASEPSSSAPIPPSPVPAPAGLIGASTGLFALLGLAFVGRRRRA